MGRGFRTSCVGCSGMKRHAGVHIGSCHDCNGLLCSRHANYVQREGETVTLCPRCLKGQPEDVRSSALRVTA